MSEMVSRVAEALARSFRDTVARVSGESWEETGVTLPSKEVFERYAIAAIKAMREPTLEMQRSGFHAANDDIGGDWIGKVEVQTTIGSTAWRTMIDEALK